MGDVGSLFLGYMLAVVGLKLRFAAESPFITWPVPVLVLGIPIFDTSLVFISRRRRGQSFLKGGTDHASHRLARAGFGRYGVPFCLGLVGSALGAAAIIVMFSDLLNSLAMQVMAAVIAVYAIYKLEFRASYEFITGKTPSVETIPETASQGFTPPPTPPQTWGGETGGA
jgi:UDP-GlcNAc:undecaprenyl-phosphate GlcNAc-1-phosphate transferase